LQNQFLTNPDDLWLAGFAKLKKVASPLF